MFKIVRRTALLLALMIAALTAYVLIQNSIKPDLSKPVDLHLTNNESFGTDTGAGNVVGIEPYMEPLDYATPERFKAKIEGYIKAARAKGWIKENTIVMLPEHIGTWMIAFNEGANVFNAKTTDEAMMALALNSPISFLSNRMVNLNEQATDKNAAALFAMNATKASLHPAHDIYSNLAKKYNITVIDGSLAFGHMSIFNSSTAYSPNTISSLTEKVHPIPSETPFTAKGKLSNTQLLGAVATLICADSWFDDTVSHVAGQGAKVLLVPSFLTGTSWDDPWGGYLNDQDYVDDSSWKSDVGKITEGEAWIKYALPAKAKKYGINWGMNIFMKGQLWDMKGSGRALIIENGTLHVGKGGDDTASIYNLWLK